MADILALLLPFFGLIVIGFIAARLTRQPAEALGWMNIFIIYAALPALFFRLVSRTPIVALPTNVMVARIRDAYPGRTAENRSPRNATAPYRHGMQRIGRDTTTPVDPGGVR